LIVRNSLIVLHWMGLVGGFVYLACSLIENRVACGRFSIFSPNHMIVTLMLLLTAISQFSIIPKMDTLQALAGGISALPANSPIRLQFNFLHSTSTRVEEAVLLLGLILLYLTSRRPVSSRSQLPWIIYAV
jgi:hypothetical protein